MGQASQLQGAAEQAFWAQTALLVWKIHCTVRQASVSVPALHTMQSQVLRQQVLAHADSDASSTVKHDLNWDIGQTV